MTRTPTLPQEFLDLPIAHRALHDEAAGRAENNIAAIDAAIEHGFAVELDIQQSKDGVPMVFHDYHMSRLTEGTGPFAQHTSEELARLRFHTGEVGVPSLAQVLEHIDGRVPVLLEVKDQDGIMGPNVGSLEREVAKVIKGYTGSLAVMSFNPHAMAVLAELAPDVPRGLTTCGYIPREWPILKEAIRAHLRSIPDYDRVGASFVSHQWTDLASPHIAALKAKGARILTWTIRNAHEAAQAAKVAENITFEGYVPS